VRRAVPGEQCDFPRLCGIVGVNGYWNGSEIFASPHLAHPAHLPTKPSTRACACAPRARRPKALHRVHDRPFLERKAELARLLRDSDAGILLNEHIAEDGATVFAHACRLGAEGIVSKRIDSTYQSGPCRVWIKVRNPASITVQRERSERWSR
jgi:hypothetical protein